MKRKLLILAAGTTVLLGFCAAVLLSRSRDRSLPPFLTKYKSSVVSKEIGFYKDTSGSLKQMVVWKLKDVQSKELVNAVQKPARGGKPSQNLPAVYLVVSSEDGASLVEAGPIKAIDLAVCWVLNGGRLPKLTPVTQPRARALPKKKGP